jgi:hypothetical protein
MRQAREPPPAMAGGQADLPPRGPRIRFPLDSSALREAPKRIFMEFELVLLAVLFLVCLH